MAQSSHVIGESSGVTSREIARRIREIQQNSSPVNSGLFLISGRGYMMIDISLSVVILQYPQRLYYHDISALAYTLSIVATAKETCWH